MKTIHFDSAHRRAHFQFFHRMEHPHFNVCAPVQLGPLLAHVRRHKLPFMVTMAYCVSDTANSIDELRWRIRGDQVVQHEVVHPSFSVPTDEADVFSFCEVRFSRPYASFLAAARARMAQMRQDPSFEDDPERDDYLFLSSFPWAAFTSVTHPMGAPADSVPRIVWGKFTEQGDQASMPVSIQAHHAVVDGRHAGRFYEELQARLMDPEGTLGG